MKRAISSFILRLFGWTVVVDVPDYPKCVICVAPHTSNWDFFIGKLAYLSVRHPIQQIWTSLSANCFMER